MRKDIWKFSVIISISGLVGWYVNKPTLLMLIAALTIIGWQMYRLDLLYQWLSNRKKTPYPDTSGQFYHLHRVINQRNKKNRSRKKLLTSYLKQFRKAASALPNAIVMIDRYGKIAWTNSNAETLFGIEWPSDSGVRFTDLIRNQELEDLIRLGLDDEIEISSKLNSDITINIQVVRYTDDLRMVIGRDISRLVKINQIQSNFVANVSHELKTPLTVLKGYLEILQSNTNIADELHTPLEQMSTQSNRMELIVQDLLYLAKLENEDDSSNHKPVDITNIINTIMETINERILEKQLKLELDIDYNLTIIGNHTELHSAFSNLIFNAVNYTPNNGVINVSWKTNSDGAYFCVKDNGEGIPENHLSKLTRRFYRVDTDRSREGGGTGLGLAIVKHVLQRHNAELEIESEMGLGSQFKCLFPSKQVNHSPVAAHNH